MLSVFYYLNSCILSVRRGRQIAEIKLGLNKGVMLFFQRLQMQGIFRRAA